MSNFEYYRKNSDAWETCPAKPTQAFQFLLEVHIHKHSYDDSRKHVVLLAKLSISFPSLCLTDLSESKWDLGTQRLAVSSLQDWTFPFTSCNFYWVGGCELPTPAYHIRHNFWLSTNFKGNSVGNLRWLYLFQYNCLSILSFLLNYFF